MYIHSQYIHHLNALGQGVTWRYATPDDSQRRNDHPQAMTSSSPRYASQASYTAKWQLVLIILHTSG